ncbi:MAG: hypothetical protein ABJE66_05430 [Deltaproteobacteria bacterium]
MTYRNDLDALAARKTALEFEVEQKTRERDLAAMLLHEAKARAKLPVLDNIRVATPCKADWNDMVGDERVRHCMKCDKDVFNLSQMTREDAESLLHEKQGNLCARYFQRADGTILTSDCVVGKQQRRRRRVMAVGAAALLAGGGAFTWKLMTHQQGEVAQLDVTAGEIEVLGGMQGPPPPDDTLPEHANVETASPDLVMGQTVAPLEPPHTSHEAPAHKVAAKRTK